MKAPNLSSAWVAAVAIGCLYCWAQSAGAQPFASQGSVLSSGGGVSSGGAFSVSGTIGEPAAGFAAGGNYSIQSGFWSFELAIQTPEAPYLSVKRIGGAVEISWAADGVEYRLEETASLGGNLNWSEVGPTPVVSDGRKVVTLPLQAGHRFFRLRQP